MQEQMKLLDLVQILQDLQSKLGLANLMKIIDVLKPLYFSPPKFDTVENIEASMTTILGMLSGLASITDNPTDNAIVDAINQALTNEKVKKLIALSVFYMLSNRQALMDDSLTPEQLELVMLISTGAINSEHQ